MRPEIPSKRTEIDLAVPKTIYYYILGHHIGKIGISLNAVEEFGVAVTVSARALSAMLAAG
jgi:hypothetical protein